jgi:excisionase family DNA binding protein
MKKNRNSAKVVETFAEQRHAANVSFDQYRGRMIAPQACARELGLSEFTIHRWIRDGKIGAVKLSARCTRIEGDSLADYMTANRFVPGIKEAQPDQLKRSRRTSIELAGQA